MTSNEKYKYWIMLSDYDLETVDVLIAGKRWVYVAYLCQQATERQLKGIYVMLTGKEAPKTHNLNFLFAKISESDPIADASAQSNELQEKLVSYEDFMLDLMFYYMSDYPFSYKNIMSRFVDEEKAMELYGKTKECIAFLRGLYRSTASDE